MTNLDKKLLKRLKILYIEDDDSVRNELYSLLSNFFDTVYVSEDGEKGLACYIDKQDNIDVIITDFNMPNLNGISLIEKVREYDKKIPIILTSAYSENNFLHDAIKLRVFECIIKPIDIRKLMEILGEIASKKYSESLLTQQNKELKKYKDILYSNNIIVKTNKNLKISFVNELFCNVTGFEKKELLGKDLAILKHDDTDSKIYKKIYNSVFHNKQLNVELKNITKDGGYYISDTSIISTLNDSGEVTGCLMIQKDETKKVLKRREVQTSLIKDKGEIFIKGKENSAELIQDINNLKDEIIALNKNIKDINLEKENYVLTLEKYSMENKQLRRDLKFREKSNLLESVNSNTIKLTKENIDLKMELKKMDSKILSINEDHEKEIKQIKVNYEVKIDDLDKEIALLKEQLLNVENPEEISQKLAYWKEKAKNESLRVKNLEKEIIKHGDKNIMNKLFGGK